MKRLTAFLLALALLLAGCGNGGTVPTAPTETEPTEEIVEKDPGVEISPELVADKFAMDLFRQTAEAGENTLVSPLSVLTALAMTANGAQGDTLAQIEETIGMSREDLNRWLKRYLTGLSKDELAVANSAWIRDDEHFTPDKAYLDILEKQFRAELKTAVFDDATLEEINGWVEEKTDGMIVNILDEIPEEAVMYLINALAFDAAWKEPYTEYQVQDGHFTTEDGRVQKIEMMYDTATDYLRTENAAGFLKWYEGGRYAFAALLPEEGVTVEQLLNTLDVAEVLANREVDVVQTAIPKFESGVTLDMADVLAEMGMAQAFDQDTADLSTLGSYTDRNLYISRVLHKTYIQVAEQGTRAGAATAVEIAYATGAGPVEEPTTVYLDRPFVYMIVDAQQMFPIFMGTCMEVTP